MRQSQREFQEHLVAMAQKEHQDDSVFEKVRKQEQEKEVSKYNCVLGSELYINPSTCLDGVFFLIFFLIFVVVANT
jgi:hypothetical protein